MQQFSFIVKCLFQGFITVSKLFCSHTHAPERLSMLRPRTEVKLSLQSHINQLLLQAATSAGGSVDCLQCVQSANLFLLPVQAALQSISTPAPSLILKSVRSAPEAAQLCACCSVGKEANCTCSQVRKLLYSNNSCVIRQALQPPQAATTYFSVLGF